MFQKKLQSLLIVAAITAVLTLMLLSLAGPVVYSSATGTEFNRCPVCHRQLPELEAGGFGDCPNDCRVFSPE